ncbi:hypothetical protein P8C59_001667 [Phyllachora maydis]|uniref:Mitochondrial inner membrane protease subunit n=1 Tax=Phyllachora maydis TaxID=1825666 RepID=A0AAD9MBM7_9PEZI|nr:hypothetical protein P8C59_001667 [Phyllachora maydis]
MGPASGTKHSTHAGITDYRLHLYLSYDRASPRAISAPPRRRSLLLYFVQGTLLLHIFTEHFFALKRGDGPSMLPTAEVTGQWFLVSKHHSRGRGLHVGDLVIFDLPFHRDDMGMKRVLGLPGDYVLVDAPRTPITATTSDELMIQVPEGHCWLVGDNVPASRDSRLYGPVPLALVRGKIVARYWPWRDRRVFGPALAAAGPEANKKVRFGVSTEVKTPDITGTSRKRDGEPGRRQPVREGEKRRKIQQPGT